MGMYDMMISCFGFMLRLFATVTLVTGAGFIALGCVLENPPKAPVPASVSKTPCSLSCVISSTRAHVSGTDS